jgi:glycosyltransferase involved in cell wall biosynthesis
MIFSIIIPVYNEEKTILKILEKVDKLKFSKFEKEVIVVDDGSTDNTKNILNENKNLYDHLYSNNKNEGKGSAVKIGLQKSAGEYVVFQDGDLEYDPIDLLKFENVFIKFKADGIIGSRFSYDKYIRSHSILNKIANFFLSLFFNILYNTTFTDVYSCYFAFNKKLLNVNNLKINGFAQHAEILSKVIKKGSKFYEVPINYDGRNFSEGKKIKFYHFFPVIFEMLSGRFK